MTAAVLEVDRLSRTYGSGDGAITAIADLTFSARRGELLCVVGPSGCGKTTLLKCLGGLLAPTSGTARLDGEPVDGPPAGLAWVFQEYSRSLLPWFTARGNVAVALRRRGWSRAERRARAEAALRDVGLGHAMDRHPWQLSGGMQQRVAIARALAGDPEVLVMDEPFGAVDAQTRGELEDLLLRVHAEYGVTVVVVTHDVDEAVYLADRVIVLTSRPTTIAAVVDIDLPRPRDQDATKQLPEYAHLRAAVMRRITSPT